MIPNPKDSSRRNIILKILEKSYPDARISLRFSNTWELLVAVILSAQCTDIMVNKVTENLFKKYIKIEDYVKSDKNEFQHDIKSTGFFRNKANNILASAKIINYSYNNQVPDTMSRLIQLPGVARKTANIVLSNAFGINSGIAVDTHVLRISQRLRLVDLKNIGGKKILFFLKNNKNFTDYIKDADANKIEMQLMKIIPKNCWGKITYMIIEHGRAVCRALNPKCTICPLSQLCPCSRN
jgi:endonuclease III